MTGKVFVSYSQSDRNCAAALVAYLESEGIGCWIAPRDILPAADWAAAIIDAITAARLMVLVFSASSNDSPQVRREVERAVHKQRQVLPFRIEDVMPSSSLEYFLSSQHWMDAFPGPPESHFRRLCAYLKAPAADRAPTSAPGCAVSPDLTGINFAPIERLLAGYIGPVARHLVRQALLGGGTRDDFIASLAADIESPRDRAAFERRGRELLGSELSR